MCGIAGKLFHDASARVSAPDIERMTATIAHRGPDARTLRVAGNVGIGHCRLSIIDLSTGAQPMANEDETVWIVFNGEIYNFQELREKLAARGHVFRSRSDTEVIVHAYEEYGPDCVNHLRGMFAFAIWDAKRQRLFIARDRVGIKPLYYSQTKDALWFASEIKAIIADPAVTREIDEQTIRTFLAFNYVAGEGTLFRSIKKLPPGHYLIAENGKVSTRQYWDLRYTENRWSQTFEQSVEELQSLLAATVRDHMIADVPVGVLLSGGVDSSAMLNFAVQGTDKQVNTFTVGFDGNQVVDERPFARLAAKQFGSRHHELSITEEDFWNFLPAYAWHMEEPVCEPPAVALYYVTKLARQHVKVVLSGEGGDEAFAGYPNYPNMLSLDRIRTATGPLARPLGGLAGLMGNVLQKDRWQRYGHALGRPLASHYFSRTSGPTAFFNRHSQSFLADDFSRRTSESSAAKLVNDLLKPVSQESLLNQMLYVDSKTWLPDDLLVKADKMTMANSIELRVPLLDHQVLEFAASLRPDCKVRGKETKRVLKAAFAKVLPAEILNRKKAGFPVPYEGWLRNGLSNRVSEVLLSERSVARNFFKKPELSRVLESNVRAGGFGKEVFSLLSLELCLRALADQTKTAPVPAN
ncbi:MAG: asparagine synthase (glutamine-hydrolyzing) [Verrucomicrobiota bacterium]